MQKRRGSVGTVIAIIIACAIAAFSYSMISSKNEELEAANQRYEIQREVNQSLRKENQQLMSGMAAKGYEAICGVLNILGLASSQAASQIANSN